MYLVKPSAKIEGFYMDDPHSMERIGRVCYKSEDKITDDSAEKFIKARLGQHESVIEHSALTVRFICDRGVTHELVRHRLCSFSQESSRYVSYKGGVTFIIPPWINICPGEKEHDEGTTIKLEKGDTWDSIHFFWVNTIAHCESTYIKLLKLGWKPEQARSVLPNSTKTEIVMTANFREWRHIFKLRCNKAAHPQMRELMIPLLVDVKAAIPIIFDDIYAEGEKT